MIQYNKFQLILWETDIWTYQYKTHMVLYWGTDYEIIANLKLSKNARTILQKKSTYTPFNIWLNVP